MKSLKNILVLLLVALIYTSCKNDTQPEIKTVAVASDVTNDVEKQLDPNATYAKAEFTIEGMTCQIGCANTIQKKLAKLDGVKTVEVDFEKKLGMIEFDDAKQTHTTIENTVANIADVYKVKDMKTVDAFQTEK